MAMARIWIRVRVRETRYPSLARAGRLAVHGWRRERRRGRGRGRGILGIKIMVVRGDVIPIWGLK